MDVEKTSKPNRIATHVSFKSALQMGPPPKGNLATPVFAHGSLEAELYRPVEIDSQTPHSRDELYVVARGSGHFFDGEKFVEVAPGSFIFVPSGTEHRFQEFSEDFAVWVFFYGPEGGE